MERRGEEFPCLLLQVPGTFGPAAYIAPEQDSPEAFNPSSLKQVRDIADARTWRVVSLMDDGGRPAPEMIEQGLSTSEMIDYRLNASQSHIPVLMARKPLPENVPLGAVDVMKEGHAIVIR